MGFQDLKKKLEFFFFNDEKELLDVAENFIKENPKYKEGIYKRSLASEDKIYNNSSFYGYDPLSSLTLDEQFSYEQVSKFSRQDLLDSALQDFDILRKTLDLGGDFDSAKMKTSAIPRGVFNFSLASKGLVRKVEFYDEVNDIIVDIDLVQSEDFGGSKLFYYINNGRKLTVRKQQEGTYSILKHCSKDVVVKYDKSQQMFLPYKDDKIFNGCSPYNLKFVSKTKKVYMYRERLGGGLAPKVDLFLVVGGTAEFTTENFLAKNLPIFIVADVLERAGVKTRIYGVRAFSGNESYSKTEIDKNIFIPFALKDYGENLDFNRLASFTSDNRFFRVSLWRAISAIRKKNYVETSNKEEPFGVGTTLYGYRENIKDNLYDIFAMFKNWLFNQKGMIKNDTKINNRNLMIIGGLRNLKKTDKLSGDTKEKTYEKIKLEVYRILDYVGLQVTKNVDKFIQKIYQRVKEYPENINKSEQEVKNSLRNYLIDLINENMPIVPDLGNGFEAFATPIDTAREINEKKEELFKAIESFLS